MKVKKYKVNLKTPYDGHTTVFRRLSGVTFLLDSLDGLWRFADFEEWDYTIVPYWEEVSEDA